MRLRLLQWAILLGACHANPLRPPSLPPMPDLAPAVITPTASLQACAATPTLKPENVCHDEFTIDGVACVNCGGLSGCFDAVDQIYCVERGCALDAHCAVHPESAPLPVAHPARRKNDAPH